MYVYICMCIYVGVYMYVYIESSFVYLPPYNLPLSLKCYDFTQGLISLCFTLKFILLLFS